MALLDALKLPDRWVVVAGAGGGGIGTSICRWLAEAGASIMALDNRPEALAIVENELKKIGGRYEGRIVDLCKRDEVEAAVAATSKLGPLLGAVQVAGGTRQQQWHALLDLDTESYDQVFDLNFNAALYLLQATASRLVDQGTGGSIVSISSIAGLNGMPFVSAYAASKAALMSVTRSAALELGKFGIRVNAVAPGTIRTPKNLASSNKEMVDSPAELATLPLKRRGRPDDIASAVLFLMSDMANYITGQVLAVDGGSTAMPSFLDGDMVPVSVRDEGMRARLRKAARS